jgi:hypothetical protein
MMMFYNDVPLYWAYWGQATIPPGKYKRLLKTKKLGVCSEKNKKL